MDDYDFDNEFDVEEFDGPPKKTVTKPKAEKYSILKEKMLIFTNQSEGNFVTVTFTSESEEVVIRSSSEPGTSHFVCLNYASV